MNSAAPRTRIDDEARRRIRTDLESNLIVEAGAGSGKTHELAARMAAGVAAGAYTLERMAAVTFTRKAAAELRGRFQLALESELAAVPTDQSARAERIRSALANLERFFAGTIHAFCARLLGERPVEAGVSPGFTEIDDVEERLLREQSWRDYRTQAKAAGDPDLVALLDAGIRAKHLDKAFETICLYEDVTFPPGEAPMPDATRVWAAATKFWNTLDPLLPSPIPDDSTCKTQERADQFRRKWRAHARGDTSHALLAEMLALWQRRPVVVLKWWASKAIAKQAEQLHADFRDTVVLPFLTEWRQYLYRRSVTLLTRARDAAAAERRRRNALSFNDLLILTARVLRTNAGVRRALQDKYRWLFVDEFQDTDPVQAEIVFLLAADETPIPGVGFRADWRTATLRPGALFVVGDPKQSIYRFRRADIDIYNEVRARIGGADGVNLVRLTTNFRSVPGLCAWVNGVFQSRFPATPTAEAPMFAPLDSSQAPDVGARPHVATIDLPDGVDGGDLAREEAARVARYIRVEVDAGRRTFGDFLILTRRKKGLRPYAAALEALEVPIEVSGAGAFGESSEVRVLALLLAALSDPQDAVSLVGVLRGPLFGVSDRDLFAFRAAGGRLHLFSDLPNPISVGSNVSVEAGSSDPANPTAVTSALAALRRWHAWTRALPAGAALDRILEDSGYLALGATSPGGVEAGDLLHAIDRVRAAVERGFTLADAASALAAWSGLDDDEEAIAESSEVDSLPLEPGRHDVVRLMNLHKAKGLEADVVILADPLGGFEPRVDVRIVRGGGAAEPLGYFQIVSGRGYASQPFAEPADWSRHEAIEAAYLRAEVDRLLYVAATRARETLVAGRWTGKPGNRKWAWDAFTPHLAGVPALAIPASVAPPARQQIDLSDARFHEARRAYDAAHDRVRRASWAATSVTAELKRLPRFVTEDSGADAGQQEFGAARPPSDPTRALLPDSPSHRADAGLAWGALVHGLLEHAMRHRSATPDDLRRLASWLTIDDASLRPAIDRAVETVRSVVDAAFWQAAREAPERHEEVPFAVRDPSPTPPRIVTGTIDLVHRAGDGWCVIDYKTDVHLDDQDAERAYAAQVAAYARAWGTIASAPVTTEIVGVRKKP